MKVLQNLPESDEELTREDTRLDALVDLLPFLRAGYWKGVHIYSLTDEAKREIAEPDPGMMAYGGYGGMEGYGGDPSMMMGSEVGYDSGYGMEMDMYGMGGGYGGFGGGEANNFPKSEAEQVMVRSIDFTVRPNTIYRYRARIVVFNPNKDREDVAAGVDNKTEELFGPWSETTDEVLVPADVTAYAMEMAPGARGAAPDKVRFQVARWSEDDGITAVKAFEAGPGQILGFPSSARVPILDDLATSKETTRAKSVDFNTRQLVLDTAGGMQAIPPIASSADRVLGNYYAVPAMALMLRPDGAIVVRDEAVDKHNDEMKEMVENYRRMLDDAEQQKKAGSMMMNPYGGS